MIHVLKLLNSELHPALLLLLLALTGCSDQSGHPAVGQAPEGAALPAAASASRGRELISIYGCGSCHRIPGINAADGNVGPPLVHIRSRGYLGGIVPNSFENMVLWLTETQRIAPESAMPDLGLSNDEARDIAAYLYQMD